MSITPLEKRTAGLELALEQTVSFGESILAALQETLERVGELETVLEQTSAFNASVPNILREISERVIALEQVLREDMGSGESSEKALMEFSKRMDALRRSIPKTLEHSTPHADVTAALQSLVKSVELPSAPDPAMPAKFREVSERIDAIENAMARMALQGQSNTKPGVAANTSAATAADSAALGSLRDTLKSVIERMSIMESSMARLSIIPPQAGLNAAALDPLKESIKAIAERIRMLENREPAPATSSAAAAPAPVAPAPVEAPAPSGFGSSFLEALRKISERVGKLESKSDWQAESGGGGGGSALPDNAQLLAHASKLYPKTKTVVFVGTENFSDNLKYAYLAFCSFVTGKDIAASFLCGTTEQYEEIRAAGLPCISPLPSEWSSDDAKTLISAKVAVLGDNFHARGPQGPMAYALLQGAKSVQLWHGIPFKEIGLQNLFATRGGNVLLADALASCGTFDVMVAPATVARREWERWFSFREFAPIGMPRTDIFFQNLTPHDRLNVDEKTLAAVQDARAQNKRVILYAPTFRDHNPAWFEEAGLGALATHCRDRGWLLYVNLHPREQGAVEELRSQYRDINFVAPGTDIYPIAKFTDCLVTDYSSLAFDFLYCDKPVVFYRPDHADYIARARALVANYEILTVGPVTSTVESLTVAVADVFDRPDMDMFRDARAILRKKLFDYQDGKVGARFCAIIQRHLEPGIRFVPVVS